MRGVRLARLTGWRYTRFSSPDRGQALLLTITDGPQAELGRQVQVPVSQADLAVLEGIVAALKAIGT